MDQLYHDQALVAVYDALNSGRDDFDFYLSRLPPAPARVLDIGCGTGTFALMMATRGYDVTGVDPASAMLAHAKSKPGSDAVTWITGTAFDLPPNAVFDAAVMTGHAFQCLTDDSQIAGLFDQLVQHLHPQGSFWFETRHFAARPWLNWRSDKAGPPVALTDGSHMQVKQEVLSVEQGFVTFQESYAFLDRPEQLSSTSTLRFLDLPEIRSFAGAAGLRVAHVFGDWDGSALSPASPEIIVELCHT